MILAPAPAAGGWEEGLAAIREGRPAEAIEHLEPLLERHPDDAKLRELLALAYEAAGTPYVQQGAYREASSHLRRAVELSPDDIERFELYTTVVTLWTQAVLVRQEKLIEEAKSFPLPGVTLQGLGQRLNEERERLGPELEELRAKAADLERRIKAVKPGDHESAAQLHREALEAKKEVEALKRKMKRIMQLRIEWLEFLSEAEATRVEGQHLRRLAPHDVVELMAQLDSTPAPPPSGPESKPGSAPSAPPVAVDEEPATPRTRLRRGPPPDEPAAAPRTPELGPCTRPIHGSVDIRFRIGENLHEGALRMQGCSGSMDVRYFHPGLERLEEITETLRVHSSPEGTVLVGSDPVYKGSDRVHPDYHPDSVRIRRGADGAEIFEVCDNQEACAPAEVVSRQLAPRIVLRSACDRDLWAAALYLRPDGQWTRKGWWQVRPGSEAVTDIQTLNEFVFFYAQADGFEWSGAGKPHSVARQVVGTSFETPDAEALESGTAVEFYRSLVDHSEPRHLEVFDCPPAG